MPGDDIESRGGGVKSNKGNNNNSHASFSSYPIENTASEWASWLVPMIVVANIVVFIVVMYINNCPEQNYYGFGGKCELSFLGRFSFQPGRDNPLFGPSSPTLEKLGALAWMKIVYKHQGWRLVTCIWLHAGVYHLLSNTISLLFIGIRLEQQFGFVRIGIIYMLSGFGGSILSSLFIHNSISVGASGALSGLLGAMLSVLLTNWTIYTNKAAALVTFFLLISLDIAIGLMPYVDNFSLIGGFLTGFLLGFILLPRPQFGWSGKRNLPSGPPVKSKYVLWQVSVVLLIAGFTVALVMLFRGENGFDHCHWCHYLSCVPNSIWSCDDK
ncbi:Rhomboid domain-containing protein [Cephalotus follicularis]|uniref:RHOMBOID-like protein n=1 Tax=Cephalotus follicularis TaxID=3775 RepID=A0A1Q3BXG4_CEPFO|nr:Rhomboid domain-containing protein [Cephalotus follicularis]